LRLFNTELHALSTVAKVVGYQIGLSGDEVVELYKWLRELVSKRASTHSEARRLIRVVSLVGDEFLARGVNNVEIFKEMVRKAVGGQLRVKETV